MSIQFVSAGYLKTNSNFEADDVVLQIPKDIRRNKENGEWYANALNFQHTWDTRGVRTTGINYDIDTLTNPKNRLYFETLQAEQADAECNEGYITVLRTGEYCEYGYNELMPVEVSCIKEQGGEEDNVSIPQGADVVRAIIENYAFRNPETGEMVVLSAVVYDEDGKIKPECQQAVDGLVFGVLLENGVINEIPEGATTKDGIPNTYPEELLLDLSGRYLVQVPNSEPEATATPSPSPSPTPSPSPSPSPTPNTTATPTPAPPAGTKEPDKITDVDIEIGATPTPKPTPTPNPTPTATIVPVPVDTDCGTTGANEEEKETGSPTGRKK